MVNLIGTLTLFHSMGLTFFSFHFISRLLEVYILRIQFTCIFSYLLGSKDRAVVRLQVSHQCDPGPDPGFDVVRGLSLLLVLFFAPRGFPPGSPVFPCPQKPTLLNSN